MAEMPNRDDLEKRFAKKFGAIATRHMREFSELLGDPPDIENIPQEFWDKIQHEVENDLYAILLLIWSDSATLHGWIGPQANLAAYGWAKRRSQDFAEYWTNSSRERLESGFEKLREIEPPSERTFEEAKEVNRLLPEAYRRSNPNCRPEDIDTGEIENPMQGPAKEDVDNLIEQVFGAHRIAQNAIDEVTRGQHAGGEAAIEETVGISEDDLWRVQEISPGKPDDEVCPLCRSVNRVKRKDWPWRLSDGPPCHPNDRCFVEYANVPLSEAIGRMIDDSDAKSIRRPMAMKSEAWYRDISNAAEWRAYCVENDVEFDDRLKFKSFNPSEARDESGKWTSGSSNAEHDKMHRRGELNRIRSENKLKPDKYEDDDDHEWELKNIRKANEERNAINEILKKYDQPLLHIEDQGCGSYGNGCTGFGAERSRYGEKWPDYEDLTAIKGMDKEVAEANQALEQSGHDPGVKLINRNGFIEFSHEPNEVHEAIKEAAEFKHPKKIALLNHGRIKLISSKDDQKSSKSFSADEPRDESGKWTASTSESGKHFETGKPVKFDAMRNTQSSQSHVKPKRGGPDPFQQAIEPHGRYMLHDTMNSGKEGKLPNGWQHEEVEFKNPLVIKLNSNPDGGIYDDSSWKKNLAKQFNATGKKLSEKIAKAGHDGIVTIDGEGNTSEIVDLRHLIKST